MYDIVYDVNSVLGRGKDKHGKFCLSHGSGEHYGWGAKVTVLGRMKSECHAREPERSLLTSTSGDTERTRAREVRTVYYADILPYTYYE